MALVWQTMKLHGDVVAHLIEQVNPKSYKLACCGMTAQKRHFLEGVRGMQCYRCTQISKQA